jgi:hypothetical protein
MYKTGGWPKDVTEVRVLALKQKPKAAKCSDHRTFFLTAHTYR